VEGRIIERHRAFEMLVAILELTQMKQRSAQRPFADHLQVGIAEPLEERHHLARDVMRDVNVSRDDVMGRHADEDGDYA
jgi:hypothetical protein